MERMLVALDGSRNAEQVLPYVEELGKKMGLAVDLLRVCLPGEPRDKTYLADLAKGLAGSGIDARARMLDAESDSHVPETILDYAEGSGVLLITLVSHARSGITREVCGTTAKHLLNHSTLPIMIVRTRAAQPASVAVPDAVLVTLDGSKLAEAAIPLGEKLARRMKGDLVLFRVGEPAYQVMPVDKPRDVAPLAEREKKARAEATEYVTRIADEIRARRRAKVRMEIQLGVPADTIVKRAGQGDIGLVVMSTHGRSGLSRLVFGSVTGAVLSRAPVPVVILRPQAATS